MQQPIPLDTTRVRLFGVPLLRRSHRRAIVVHSYASLGPTPLAVSYDFLSPIAFNRCKLQSKVPYTLVGVVATVDVSHEVPGIQTMGAYRIMQHLRNDSHAHKVLWVNELQKLELCTDAPNGCQRKEKAQASVQCKPWPPTLLFQSVLAW